MSEQGLKKYMCIIETVDSMGFPFNEANPVYLASDVDAHLAAQGEELEALHSFSMLNLDPVHEQFGLDMVKKKTEWNYQAELPYEDPAWFTPYGHTQTMNAKAGRAIVLWDTVKRECWSTP